VSRRGSKGGSGAREEGAHAGDGGDVELIHRETFRYDAAAEAVLEDGELGLVGIVVAGFLGMRLDTIGLEGAEGGDEGTTRSRLTRASRSVDLADVAVIIDGNVREGEEDVALALGGLVDRGMREAGAHAGDAACDDGAEAVDVEVGAEDGLDLGLEDASGLVTAQIRDGDRVVATEAVSAEHDFSTSQVIIGGHRAWEVFLDVDDALAHVAGG